MPANRARTTAPAQDVHEPRIKVRIVDLIAPGIVNSLLNMVVQVSRDDITVVPLESRRFRFRLLDVTILCEDLTMGTVDEPTVVAAVTYATARFFAQLDDDHTGPKRTAYTLRLSAR